MYTILLILFIILFSYLSYKNIVLALGIILFALPAFLIRFSFFNIPTTLLEIMIWVLFFVWIYKVIKEKRKIDFSNYKWLILIFLIAGLISIFTSSNFYPAVGIYKAYFIDAILLYLIFINEVKNKKDLKTIFYFLGSSAILISLFAIYQKITGNFIDNEFWRAQETRRVVSFYGYPNALGLYLAPLVILYSGFCYYKKFVNRFFSLAVIILSLLAIFFAVSEGALVSIFTGLILFGLLNKKLRIVTLVFLVLCGIMFFTIPKVNEYLPPKILLEDTSGVIRKDMWHETWLMLKQSPIWGAGLAGYQKAVEPFHSKDYVEIYLYPHNLILNFWSETGLLGLFAFWGLIVLFFVNAIKDSLKNKNVLQIVLICAMTAVLVHGLVDVPYFKNDLAILFWMILGWQVVFGKNKISSK